MDVLHLTAHLGGGVGKALSGLAARASRSGGGVRHTIVCLEPPEKDQFLNQARDTGCEVIVCPDSGDLAARIMVADVVQLEWWNHPATIQALCDLPDLPVRLIAWSHISGLHNPIIPQGLMLSAHKTLFTSPCSLEAAEVSALLPQIEDCVGVVSSSGGFAGLPQPSTQPDGAEIAVGYVGSLNFAKLHPRYVDYLAAVALPGFTVRLIGDATNQGILTRQCEHAGKAGLLAFRGYSTDIASELASINVLAYLLNPEHYGTTENALLEAMAMGIVPIVLDNPAERRIVEDRKTGLIVRSPAQFAQAVEWLAEHPGERTRLGTSAARSVRERFTAENMEARLNEHYRSVMASEKRSIGFRRIFGETPSDWFLACQGNRALFRSDGAIDPDIGEMARYGLLEKSKGTVFHFHRYFPDDPLLALWAQHLEALQ